MGLLSFLVFMYTQCFQMYGETNSQKKAAIKISQQTLAQRRGVFLKIDTSRTTIQERLSSYSRDNS